jgi:hypothetical protein
MQCCNRSPREERDAAPGEFQDQIDAQTCYRDAWRERWRGAAWLVLLLQPRTIANVLGEALSEQAARAKSESQPRRQYKISPKTSLT